ncbi:uncharacterized protein LOC143250665 isoform X1 [Tachypleus tridentatus]|uniref:uncharacterized protein LOC143250665 isoform X1 n=1 Tax=Tachypleus tridentatus TaxID=6853 RepID=UPI003FD3EB97
MGLPLSFSHKPKIFPKERPLFPFPQSYPKSSNKRVPPFLPHSLNQFQPRPFEQSKIPPQVASIVLERTPIFGNDIENDHMDKNYEEVDLMTESISNKDILRQQSPIQLPQFTPFQYNQQRLPRRYPILKELSIPTDREFSFPRPLESLSFPNPQSLPSQIVPQIFMTKRSPTTPLSSIAPLIAMHYSKLQAYTNPSLMGLMSPPAVPFLQPNPYIRSPMQPLERVMVLLHPVHVPVPVPVYPRPPLPMIPPLPFAMSAPRPFTAPQPIFDYSPIESVMEESVYIPRPPPTFLEQIPRFMESPPLPNHPQFFRTPVLENSASSSIPSAEETLLPEQMYFPIAQNMQPTSQPLPPPRTIHSRYVQLPFLQEQESEPIIVPFPEEHREEPKLEPILLEKQYPMSLPFNVNEENIPSTFPHPRGPNTQRQLSLKHYTEKEEPTLMMMVYEDDQEDLRPQTQTSHMGPRYPQKNIPMNIPFPGGESFNKMKLIRETLMQKQAILPGIRYNSEPRNLPPPQEAESRTFHLTIPLNPHHPNMRPIF